MTTETVHGAYGEWATQIEGMVLVHSNAENYYLVPSKLYHERYRANDYSAGERIVVDDNYTPIGRQVAEAMIRLAYEPAAEEGMMKETA